MAAKPPNLELVDREPLTAEIARKLLGYLLSGDIELGERLPSERQLAQSMGVGRSAVREALKALGFLGLVEARQGGGTYFRNSGSDILPQVVEWGLLLHEPHMLDLVEARGHIEVVVAGLAAERRDEQALEELRELLGVMREAGDDTKRFVEADANFHMRLAKAAENNVLSSVVMSIQSLMRVWIRRVIEAAGETNSSYLEHVPIFDSVERRDAAQARAAMGRHLDAATARLMRTLQDDNVAESTPVERDAPSQ
jgi:GntR family transcriptional repressor for pyruvate dehydrogenase complex